MKKQKQKDISISSFSEMARAHKQKEVAPPAEAARGMDGKYGIDRARAAQYWFKAAKEQDPSKGFLGVTKSDVEVKDTTAAPMLTKGKKK